MCSLQWRCCNVALAALRLARARTLSMEDTHGVQPEVGEDPREPRKTILLRAFRLLPGSFECEKRCGRLYSYSQYPFRYLGEIYRHRRQRSGKLSRKAALKERAAAEAGQQSEPERV